MNEYSFDELITKFNQVSWLIRFFNNRKCWFCSRDNANTRLFHFTWKKEWDAIMLYCDRCIMKNSTKVKEFTTQEYFLASIYEELK